MSANYFNLYEHIRDRPLTYLFPLVHPAYVVVEGDLDAIFDPYHDGLITEEAVNLLVECDIILRGPNRITGELITVPVIVSVQITPDDIIRAVQTAGILRAIGFDSEPMVFGRNTDNQTLVFAASQSVMVRTHKDWR